MGSAHGSPSARSPDGSCAVSRGTPFPPTFSAGTILILSPPTASVKRSRILPPCPAGISPSSIRTAICGCSAPATTAATFSVRTCGELSWRVSELIAYLPADLSYAPAIDGEEPQEDSLPCGKCHFSRCAGASAGNSFPAA